MDSGIKSVILSAAISIVLAATVGYYAIIGRIEAHDIALIHLREDVDTLEEHDELSFHNQHERELTMRDIIYKVRTINRRLEQYEQNRDK